ncbi:hypothetical protein AB6N24_08890 [Cellulomonas sp. 179-A 4D5 NHS]|uniref:hypothetical protein n=1 Tax=Cellulomonas sp. 179-A 4D5 NHS TaxID=3142378 RepID=UPI0039A29E4F
MDFYRLSPERAAEFCAHVGAREPYLLRQLASWLDQTGGPLDAMDASVDSLVPLWEWYCDLISADFLGLTEGLMPSTLPKLFGPGLPEDLERARSAWVVADRLVHYARLVLARLVQGARWAVCHMPPDHRHQSPSVVLPGWKAPKRLKGDWPVAFFDVVGAFALAATTDEARKDALRTIIVRDCPPELVAVHQSPEPSVLRPYLTADLPPMPGHARVTPALAWLDDPAPGPEPAFSAEEEDWEDLVLAKGPALGLEDEPWLLTSLPADRVAAALKAGGFMRVTAAGLLREEELEHPGGIAQMATLVSDGALRAVYIEPIDPTPQSWERLVAPLRMLAAELGANLVPHSDYPD